MAVSPLLPERHAQRDFFIADIFDNLPFKDDIASMGHPLFTLSTRPDFRTLKYSHEGVTLQVEPGARGLPTIFDKDVLLYCGSQVMEQLNRGNIPPRTLRVSLHDLLIATNRDTSGVAYEQIKNSIHRLTGCLMQTNIKTANRRQAEVFHLIESARVVESERFKGRLVSMEITLSEWYYNSLIAREVLTIDRDYFRLRKSIDRRLYEIARKHCGSKRQWSVALDTLHLKSGSRDVLYKFRAVIKTLEKENHLPNYRVSYNREKDQVTFINRNPATVEGQAKQQELDLPPAEIPPEMAEEGWALCGSEDIYALWAEWQAWNRDNGRQLKDWRRAFLGFCRKRGK